MPYSVDKGPGISLLESAFNGATDDELVAFIEQAGALVDSVDVLKSDDLTTLMERTVFRNGTPTWWSGGPKSLKDHFEVDWYTPSTGFFLQLQGEVQRIMAEALRRAMIIATGYDENAEKKATRRWPIDVWWVCPLPRFDVQVSWERFSRNYSRMPEWAARALRFATRQLCGPDAVEGRVTMYIFTPAFDGGRLFSDLETDPTQLPEDDQYHLRAGDAANFRVRPELDHAPVYPPGNRERPFRDHRRGSFIVSLQHVKVSPPAGSGSTEPVWNDVELSGRPTWTSPAVRSGGVHPD
ncbi:MAG: hypothetical protein S0880_06955 [Actinomycetota bacterium]|nr:hypothetical protein [Actinomycetota bacterium]